MRAKGLAAAACSSALLTCLLASASLAQDGSRQRAPIVRVFSQNGAGVVSSYVTPAIEVSEDAYVFAVMMDPDGRIQVLQPEFPGISVRIRSRQQLQLPNFFAGFNAPMQGARSYTRNGLASYDGYEARGDDSRGTVIALASRAPFNLELIEADGDWSISAIRRLIDHRTPTSAARSLAQYLGAKGEPIGRDYMRFAGQRQGYYAYNDFDYYAYSYGVPVVVVAPFVRGGRFRVPPKRRRPGDTTVFPKSRLPHGIAHHPPRGDIAPKQVPEAIFPLPRHSEPLRMRNATIPAPQGRRAEPRDNPDRFRSAQAARPSPPERARTPVEQTAPSRARPAATGFQPAQRPEPRVIQSPPRAQSQPRTRPEPARVPPPRHR
jgi:hypothetical protein